MNEQLQKWLDGKSVHGDECCPDFSCCTGYIAPIEQRQRYVKAIEDNDDKTKNEMLGMFLGEAISREFNKSVHVVGTDNGNFE